MINNQVIKSKKGDISIKEVATFEDIVAVQFEMDKFKRNENFYLNETRDKFTNPDYPSFFFDIKGDFKGKPENLLQVFS